MKSNRFFKRSLRLCVSLLISLAFGTATAQSIYELKFQDKQGTVYTGLLVYFSETDCYMRIGFNQDDQYNVVHVDYTAQNGESEGVKYFLLEGSNPRYILPQNSSVQYNPDYLVWVKEGEDFGLPFITDDPDFSLESFSEALSFSALDCEDVNETYLGQFFWSNEPEMTSLLEMCEQEDVVYDYQPQSKLHLIVAANTAIPDIGISCEVDLKKLKNEFEGVADALGIDFGFTEISGGNFTKANLSQALANLKPGSNDVVVFVYRGHGFRWDGQESQWPQMDLRRTAYEEISRATSMNLGDVYNTLSAKGARLNLVFGDCCNSSVGTAPMTPTTFLAAGSFSNPEVSKLRRLFLESKGNVIGTAASPGEVAWTNSYNGGFFTVSFLQSLHEEISFLRDDSADWTDIMGKTREYARYKSSAEVCPNCTEQNGISLTKVAYNP